MEVLDPSGYWECARAPEEIDVLGVLIHEDVFHLSYDGLPLLQVQFLRLLLVKSLEPRWMVEVGPGRASGSPTGHGAVHPLGIHYIRVHERQRASLDHELEVTSVVGLISGGALVCLQGCLDANLL